MINTSAVIPLEFSLQLDGISSIVMGSVFKIKADRLPKAYRNETPNGANVGFIVFSESQNITAGQDWVTTIGGKMILLPNENTGKKLGTGGNGLPGMDKLETALKELPWTTGDPATIDRFDRVTLPLKPFDPIQQQNLSFPGGLQGETQDIPPTPTSSLEGSTTEEILPPVTEEQLFKDFIDLDRKYLNKKYAHDLLVDQTWLSSTNVYANQINDLRIDMGIIVDEWESRLKQPIVTGKHEHIFYLGIFYLNQ